MRPQIEPVLESHLAAILMRELLRPREDLDDTYVDIVLDDLELDESDEYYASYELVQPTAGPTISDPTMFAAPTSKFVRVRDTSHDHVATVKYPRETLDADTLQTPKYSAPYELIDIEHPPIVTPTAQVTAAQVTAAQVTAAQVTTAQVTAAQVTAAQVTTAQFTSYPHAQFPLNSAPYEKVDLLDYSQDYSRAFVKAAPTDWSAAESTEVVSAPNQASRVIATIVVLIGALLLGLSVAVYAMSS